MAQAGVLKDHQGHWLGEVTFPNGVKAKVGIEVFTRADGSAWASFAAPLENAFDFPVRRIQEAGASVELEGAFPTMKLKWTGDRFKG